MASLRTDLSKLKNYFFPTQVRQVTANGQVTPQNINEYISKVQLQRVKHDILMWRECKIEEELAYYPHRVKEQRLYQDTVLNGHVTSCMKKRKDLTMLKNYCFYNEAGEEDEKVLALFKDKKWFAETMEYTLDAQFYGYTLINFGDIINNSFSKAKLIRRWNISPERLQLTSFVYSLSGLQFMDEEYTNWNLWVTTPNETGVADCGTGLLYKVAFYEIFCRNLIGFNGDFVELFSQPFRVGKTTKTDETERGQFAKILEDMGSAGWAMIDPTDMIEFLKGDTGNGTGWKGYENLEQRCEKKISKLFFGHADAMDSTPGKLGSEQGKESPVADALEATEKTDNTFVEMVINDQLLPKMRNLGFAIPETTRFKFANDKEQSEQEEKVAVVGKSYADIAQTMKNAGMKMDTKYFTEMTGIPAEEIEEPEPVLPEKTLKKIKSFYGEE